MSFTEETMNFQVSVGYTTGEHAQDQASTTPQYPPLPQEDVPQLDLPQPQEEHHVNHTPQRFMAPRVQQTRPQTFGVQPQQVVHQIPQNSKVHPQVAPQVHQSPQHNFGAQPHVSPQVQQSPQHNFGGQPHVSPQVHQSPQHNFGGQAHVAPQVYQSPQHNFGGQPHVALAPQVYQSPQHNFGGQPQMYQNHPQFYGAQPQVAPQVHQNHPQAFGVQQPKPHPQALGVPAPTQMGLWSTSLFDFFDDIPQCCITTWLPCITFGQTSEIIDRGASSCGVNGALYGLIMAFTGFQCLYGWLYRSKLKQQYGMPQDVFEDLCIHLWCHYCALCQEYRELQHRGFDVPLGWYGNVEKMNRAVGVTTPPVVPGGMTR